MLTILSSIWVLHVAALVTPGANVLLVSQLAASDRTRSAMFATLGIISGTTMWAMAAVLGVNAFFEAFPQFRIALQVAGAGYLLYLATRLWRAQARYAAEHSGVISALDAFRLGFMTNITNPKSAVFFTGIFSAAFPARPGPLLPVIAVTMVVCNALCWHALLAFLFSRKQVRSGYLAKQRLLNRLAGIAFGVFGLFLLATAVRQSVR
jgi:threonine/homoserine/homoserine lactone efflux protein